MTTMTLRGIDDTIAAVLKDRHDKRSQRQCRDAQIFKESFGIERRSDPPSITIWIIWPVPGAHRRMTIFLRYGSI